MSFVSIRLITADVHRLADFYERLLGTAAARTGDVFAELPTAVGTLAIGSVATVAAFGDGVFAPGENRSSIVEFLVDDVDARYADLADFLEDVIAPPTTMPWGNRSLLVRDPDGNAVNLFTPVAPHAVEKFAATPR